MTDESDAGAPGSGERESEAQPAAGQEITAPAVGAEEGAAHVVQDAYVAQRLAQESAARAAIEVREAEERELLAGEAEPDSPVGFYLTLGVIVASLLLAVIWLSGTQRPAPLPAISPRLPLAAPAGPPPGRPALPAQRAAPFGPGGPIGTSAPPSPPGSTPPPGAPPPEGTATPPNASPDTTGRPSETPPAPPIFPEPAGPSGAAPGGASPAAPNRPPPSAGPGGLPPASTVPPNLRRGAPVPARP
jgi:hypothetical protein